MSQQQYYNIMSNLVCLVKGKVQKTERKIRRTEKNEAAHVVRP